MSGAEGASGSARLDRPVGFLGGTFDPPHVGHLVAAESARVDLGLAEVRLLVAGQPWMKGPVTPAAHRVAMARLAVDGVDGVTVDDREARRDGHTYTADTLDDLAQSEPDLAPVLLIGADAAADLHRWVRTDEVLARARVVVLTRPGTHLALDPTVADRVEHLAIPAMDVSSTDLRARFASGRATRFLVPVAVDAYVRANGLYGPAA